MSARDEFERRLRELHDNYAVQLAISPGPYDRGALVATQIALDILQEYKDLLPQNDPEYRRIYNEGFLRGRLAQQEESADDVHVRIANALEGIAKGLEWRR